MLSECLPFVVLFFALFTASPSPFLRWYLVVHPVAHAGADHGEISAAAASAPRGRRGSAAVAQPAGAVSARLRGAVRARAWRLPRPAVACDVAAAGVRDRVPRFRRGIIPAGAVSGAEFLSFRRCRIDPDACSHPGRYL